MRGRPAVAWAVALAVAGVLSACKETPAPPVAARNVLADSADQIMFGTVANITDQGVLKGQIRADTGYFFDDNTRLEGRTVQVTFFTETGVKNAVLTAREGTYNERTGNMEARGNVVVVSTDGRRLTTPLLEYSQTRNQISSDSTFTLTDSTRVLTGIGFTSDPNMNNVHCLHACNGTIGQVELSGSVRPDSTRAPRPAALPPGRDSTHRPKADSARPATFKLP